MSEGIAVHAHARALVQRGVDVRLALVPYWLTDGGPVVVPAGSVSPVANYPSARMIQGVPVHTFDELEALVPQMLAFVGAEPPSVLHYHHTHHTDLAHAIAAMLEIPVVFTAHLPVGDPEVDKRKGGLAKLVERAIFRADRFIVFVEGGKQRVSSWLPGAGPRVRVVGHGVEDREEIRQVAASRGWRDPLTALFVGRFVPEKGIDDLVQAIPHALKECPELRFVLVGFRENLGHRTPQLLRERVSPELRGRVRFEPWLDRAGVERELAAADLLVAPSHFESFGLALAEAMLFGLPVVATATEGASALVEPARCGLLVPKAAPERLAAAIVSLATNTELRLSMGRSGAAYAREHLTWDPVCAAMLAVYRELLS